jgi:energy-coupling factor transporter ATP-binding protein EcfA2
LDTKTTAQVMQLLVDACKTRGITAIIVTHDQSLIQYATRVIHVDSGRLISDEKGGAAGIKGRVKEISGRAKKAAKLAKELGGSAKRAAQAAKDMVLDAASND